MFKHQLHQLDGLSHRNRATTPPPLHVVDQTAAHGRQLAAPPLDLRLTRVVGRLVHPPNPPPALLLFIDVVSSAPRGHSHAALVHIWSGSAARRARVRAEQECKHVILCREVENRGSSGLKGPEDPPRTARL